MDNVMITLSEEPELNSPILIEGLPGVGNVGKLAAEHLIDELRAVKFGEVFSKFFPPQVLVNDDGTVKLVNNEFHYKKLEGKEHDLIMLVGDYQGLTPEGQYELTDKVLDLCETFHVERIFTLGGYGMGRMVNEPRVLGAATSSQLVKEMKEHGVVFSRNEPGSGIVGASGLLLGMGMFRGIEGVCLMGETSGYFADPKSAQAVLEILMAVLEVKIDFTELEAKAQQIDNITERLKELELAEAEGTGKGDDLRYIG